MDLDIIMITFFRDLSLGNWGCSFPTKEKCENEKQDKMVRLVEQGHESSKWLTRDDHTYYQPALFGVDHVKPNGTQSHSTMTQQINRCFDNPTCHESMTPFFLSDTFTLREKNTNRTTIQSERNRVFICKCCFQDTATDAQFRMDFVTTRERLFSVHEHEAGPGRVHWSGAFGRVPLRSSPVRG
jgi:hypothetical protein